MASSASLPVGASDDASPPRGTASAEPSVAPAEASAAAGERIRDLDYAPSRNPGVPVVEAIVAVLDPLGGHVLVNLATAVALAATVVGMARLVRAWGHDNGDLIALAFLASPIVLISGTQTADFVYASAFFTWGALALVRGR